jgi:hypothetical protein
MSSHFTWKLENAFYYFAVKSPVSAFAKNFRFEVVIQFFRRYESTIAFWWNESFVNGSKMLAKRVIQDTELNLAGAKGDEPTFSRAVGFLCLNLLPVFRKCWDFRFTIAHSSSEIAMSKGF